MMKVVVIILCIVVMLAAVGYVGLHVAPKPFEAWPEATPALKTVPVPSGLPAPVQRYYKVTFGDSMPVIESAVMTTQGHMRLFGLWIPHRMRMIHLAGQGYYTIIQPTFFGYPIATLLDTYINGVAHVDMPGIKDNDPKMNAASNLALWAESTGLPSIYLTDPRVRWEPIDETHARLVVPSPEGPDSLTVTFDPATGLIRSMAAMRWRDPKDTTRSLWQTDADGSVTWDDEAPWFEMTIEETVYNVDVSQYIPAPGR